MNSDNQTPATTGDLDEEALLELAGRLPRYLPPVLYLGASHLILNGRPYQSHVIQSTSNDRADVKR